MQTRDRCNCTLRALTPSDGGRDGFKISTCHKQRNREQKGRWGFRHLDTSSSQLHLTRLRNDRGREGFRLCHRHEQYNQRTQQDGSQTKILSSTTLLPTYFDEYFITLVMHSEIQRTLSTAASNLYVASKQQMMQRKLNVKQTRKSCRTILCIAHQKTYLNLFRALTALLRPSLWPAIQL